MSWTAWDLTHSTAWLAIVALADATANIVLMPIGGVLADRGDRLRILMISYACATAQAAILAGLAFSGALTIHALTALAAVHGAAHAFSIPASYGLLPRFIAPRRLPSAIAVGAAYSQLGLFVGPALAGWIILRFGTPAAFASNVVGYGLFFLSVAAMRTPAGYRQERAVAKHFTRDVLDGVVAIWAHRGIKVILPAAVVRRRPLWRGPADGAGFRRSGARRRRRRLVQSARLCRRRGDGRGAVARPWRRRAGHAGDHPMGVPRVYRGRFGPDAVAKTRRGGARHGCARGMLRSLQNRRAGAVAAFRAGRDAGPHHEHAVSLDPTRRGRSASPRSAQQRRTGASEFPCCAAPRCAFLAWVAAFCLRGRTAAAFGSRRASAVGAEFGR